MFLKSGVDWLFQDPFIVELAWVPPEAKTGGNQNWSRHVAIYDHPLMSDKDVIYNRHKELCQKRDGFPRGTSEHQTLDSKARQWSYRRYHAFEVFDMNLYHRVPKRNSSYTYPEACSGNRCKHCNSPSELVSKIYVGGRRVVLLYNSQVKALKALEREMSQIIVDHPTDDNYRGKYASPGVVSIQCRNCDHHLYQRDDVVRMDPSTLYDITHSHLNCTSCQHRGLPTTTAEQGEDQVVLGSLILEPIEINISGTHGVNRNNITFSPMMPPIYGNITSISDLLPEGAPDEVEFIGNPPDLPIDMRLLFSPEGTDKSYFYDETTYVQEVLKRRYRVLGPIGAEQQRAAHTTSGSDSYGNSTETAGFNFMRA